MFAFTKAMYHFYELQMIKKKLLLVRTLFIKTLLFLAGFKSSTKLLYNNQWAIKQS